MKAITSKQAGTSEGTESVNIGSTGARTSPHRRLRAMVGLAAFALTTVGVLAVAPQEAHATAWNPTVTLQGRAIACSSKATWVWVEASNGERGWATRPGGNYSFRFTRVPTRGMTVRVNFGNSVCSRTTTFGVSRPAVGTYATRNVISIY